jgi:NADP-dependent 3-hydroxy acid dehydrogenase YdfG
MAELARKVALITGAGSGVGKATSLLLARESVLAGLLGSRPDPLEAVAQ